MANKVEGRGPGMPEGGSTAAEVHIYRCKPIKVNPEFKMPSIAVKEVDTNDKRYHCCMCGKKYTKQSGNFPTSNGSPLWKGNNGYVPFCKECVATISEILTSFYGGNEEHSLRHMCQMFDWYYSEDASAMTLAQVHRGNARALLYPSKMGARQVANKGTTFLDTVRDEYYDAEKMVSYMAKDSDDEDDEDEFVVTKKITKKWGAGYRPCDYEFLEEQEADWRTHVECKTKAQAELIRNICFAQLNIRRAQMSGNSKEVADAMKTFQDLLGSANLKPAQQNDNALADQNTFGTLIKKWEDEDPIPDPDPEWEDVDGIKKLVRTFFLGHLCKALHVKNDMAEEYDREMKKHTVYKPTYKQAVDEAPVDIFDANSDKGSDDS